MERGLGGSELVWEEEALEILARGADGDARRVLGALEVAADLVGRGGMIDVEAAGEALQHRFALYDKSGEEHYNLISALHKAVRGSDPQAALYWLARMIRGGEDPRYVARRLVRMAVEDIGLAEPLAIRISVAAWQAYDYLGSPEGDLALAEAAVFLATAPKSNRLYRAWQGALEAAAGSASEAVPLRIRNAPTPEMKEWGYGRGYRYDPEEPGGLAPQHYLPDSLLGTRFYKPGSMGYEAKIAERIARWERRRAGAASATPDPEVADAAKSGHEPE